MTQQHDHSQCGHKSLKWFYSHKAASFALILVAVLLVIEHWQHLIYALPYLLLLSCPLMHLFMHHGHGVHGTHDHNETKADKE